MSVVDVSPLDKAGKGYWDDLWQANPLPNPIDPRARGLRNIVKRRFHAVFCKIFAEFQPAGKSIVEIGCARLTWLPYFAKEFGLEVSGIDYSENGCRQSECLLEREGVQGRVYCADIFSPPEAVVGAYDAVVSFGVLEHFKDTRAAVEAFAKCLKPGGMMISFIPNMAGLLGTLQSVVDRANYDIHVPLNSKDFAAAHRDAGLQVQQCNYFMFCNFGMLSLEKWRNTPLLAIANPLRLAISAGFTSMEGVVPFFRPNGWTSPYLFCIALKS